MAVHLEKELLKAYREIDRLQARIDELEAKCDWKCLGISREQYNQIQAEGIREMRDDWLKNMHNEMSFSVFCDKYADKLEGKDDE